MPVAHASTALSGNATGLFAALCTANGLVYLDAETGEYVKDKKSKSHNINTSNKCPLCFIVEQNTLSDEPQKVAVSANLKPDQHVTVQIHFNSNTPYKHLQIRAPPQYS